MDQLIQANHLTITFVSNATAVQTHHIEMTGEMERMKDFQVGLLALHYIHSTIPLLPKSKISSFKPVSVGVQLSLCRT